MSQHKAIDLTGSGSILNRFKRKAIEAHKVKMAEAGKAVESLFGDRLKRIKGEDQDGSGVKSESTNHDMADVNNPVPECEWWDEIVFNQPELITHLIEHPVPLKGTLAMAKQSAVAKAIITPAEREKMRKLQRKAKVQESQDKIKMGLLQPPPPKIKMKNLVHVLGQEAASGPSAIEQTVRAQIEQRLRDHEQRNEDRKLTPEQRREKNIARWTRPLERSSVLKVSAFIIFKKIHNKIRFKITKNADQLHLGGFFLISKLRKDPTNESSEFYPSLVVAEGSSKSVKRFNRLLLHRIDWHEDIEEKGGDKDDEKMETKVDTKQEGIDDESDVDEIASVAGGGICVRIFHGTESTKRFTKWTCSEMRDLASVMSFLNDRGAPHYWSMLERFRDPKLDI